MFDSDSIAEHLALLGLSGSENHDYAAEFQRQVVQPNISAIIDKFYEGLVQVDDFSVVIRNESDGLRLKDMHRRYLTTLGMGFQHRKYFEDRFRIGLAHHHAGVSLRLYQCTYRLLQSLLIENIPQGIREDKIAYDTFIQFILKITALDMSLAIEAYHVNKVSLLEQTVENVRGEGEQLRQQLITDSLTKLSSRAFSLDSIAMALSSARSERKPMCVVMADIDHFKDINDTFGHRVGDHVLCGVASRMLAGARKADTIGRYGGDEFLLVLRDADMDESREVAERIRLKVKEDPVHVGSLEVKVTMSLGIARVRDDDDVNSFIKRADLALYAAKVTGRDRVCVESRAPESDEITKTLEIG
jgi:diguanylate cyclase (GGDEF)-like protein